MKTYSRVLLAAAAVLTLSLSACRLNETVEGQTRDAKIKAGIKSKLASDVGAATLTSVQVNVTNGVVTLAGPVHNQDEKTRAESVARSAEGVVSVNNALQITGDAAASGGMTSSAPAPTSTGMTTTTGTTTTSTTTTTTTMDVTPALTPTLPGPQ
ncbi:MAG: BON domain-containing protein [Acidobacteriota bacterium]